MSTIAAEMPAFIYNRVPSVTVDFWLIKLMAVTVGETAADYLSVHMGLGLSATSLIMSGFLVAALMLQFAQRRYVPLPYWLAVVLISVVGTLISDYLADKLEVPLATTSIIFAVALSVTFIVWYACERTLSIHTIYTTRREAFYWLAILFTFALGTSAGDLAAEGFGLGYLQAGLVYSAVITMIVVAYFVFPSQRHPPLLARLYPNATDGGVLRRLFCAAAFGRRAWLGYHHHQSCISRLHRRDRYLYEHQQGGAGTGQWSGLLKAAE